MRVSRLLRRPWHLDYNLTVRLLLKKREKMEQFLQSAGEQDPKQIEANSPKDYTKRVIAISTKRTWTNLYNRKSLQKASGLTESTILKAKNQHCTRDLRLKNPQKSFLITAKV